jgi:hypothetical protein
MLTDTEVGEAILRPDHPVEEISQGQFYSRLMLRSSERRKSVRRRECLDFCVS